MGKLSFYYGVMGAGKSEELIKIYHNYERINRHVEVFNFSMDERFANEEFSVSSRNGTSVPASEFDNDTSFINEFKAKNNPDAIMIDEGQFLTVSQVVELSTLVDYHDIDVLVFGLRTDFKCNLFNGTKTLFEVSDKLIELKTLCAFCGKKAIMNARFVDGKQVYDGEQVQIGDEEYLGVCRSHWTSHLNLNK